VKRIATLSIVATFVAMASCKEATQIVVEARTNVTYRAGIVTSFTVGSPGQTERAEATTETSEAWQGSTIGTLVVVPGSADDAALSVKLVMGVARNARECVAPDYRGCIVARRRLRYAPNEKLTLPITLYAQCQDVPCDELSTCSVLGQCVPIEPSCVDGSCELPGEANVDGGVSIDAAIDGAVESSVNDAGATDAESGATDASGGDASDGGGTPYKIDCGTTTCMAPLTCCFDPVKMQGTCATTASCAGIYTIHCDGNEDCPNNQHCCAGSNVTDCADSCGGYPEVCHSGLACPGVQACSGLHGGYYRTCQ
jgi:hypothetical protein